MTLSDSEALYSKQIHGLLYYAFVEIRHQGREKNCAPVVGLANLLHTVPFDLERAANGEIGYEDVFSSLMSRADELNCRAWIEAEFLKM
ncbi:MAG: hypothetical protein P1V19_08095 [Gimesia sp.]|nr:hypothetical protein [Gimesia sp.]